MQEGGICAQTRDQISVTGVGIKIEDFMCEHSRGLNINKIK